MSRQLLNQKFGELYKNLNQPQQQAVDAIEGPVMVIAGPGTGKTQILSARIGKILLETDATPENILCLTYTDAGTIAIRKRLQQFIGADAYKVNIYTFHSFCNDIIQENLSWFEKTSLDPISELESIELFKTLIDHFPKGHLLKRYRGDVYFEINNLRNLFSNMKREGWTPGFIEEKIEEYFNSLESRDEYIAKRAVKEYKKGDIRWDKIEEEKKRMDKLRAAVGEFDNYQKLMSAKNRYDFDDMINWVIAAFENNPELLARYQEKFQYILVDEYQDTSGTQNKLVHLLIDYWDVPNVFVVGDDDQSIFRFQGANVENMLDFATSYSKDLSVIVLKNNYRSTQPILDISKTLINKNRERLVYRINGLSKELIASKDEIKDLAIKPVIREYQTPKDETAHITLTIRQLLDEGVLPGEIAVIYKENKYGEELARYFSLKKIPYYSKRSINILLDPFIKKIITILRFLNAEHDIPYGGDEWLFEILHFDFYKVPPIEIAKLAVEVNSRKYSNEQISIRRLLSDKVNAAPKNLFDSGINGSLKNCSIIFESLIGEVSNITLQDLFSKTIQQAGILNYILQSEDKISLLQLLTALFDFIKEETARNPVMQLSHLVDMIDLMERESLPISMNRVAGNEKGVNLLTVHGSKGLEFEYVFFAGANAAVWEKKRKPGGGYKMPDTIFSSQPKSSDEEELRRLFYVALTRAEKYLFISYSKYKNDGKETEPSMFIAEMQEENDLIPEKIQLSQELVSEFEVLQFIEQKPEIEKAEEDFITAILEKFTMNVTALNNYLNCPLGFYYQSLIRIPTGKSEATEFGSAVHYALEKLFRKISEEKEKAAKKFPGADELIKNFAWYMHRHRENFTKEGFSRRMEYGEEILRNYYDKYLSVWNTVVSVERVIKGVVVNGVPLKGKLDKLEFTGNDVNVVDYKTGDVEKARLKLSPPDDKNPNGGDYWRQAVFYKILVDNFERKQWKVISTEFDFVEPDNEKKYHKEKVVIQPADMETVKQQITTVWGQIQNREFYTGCGKPECHWCNFVKENNLAIAWHEMENAEPED